MSLHKKKLTEITDGLSMSCHYSDMNKGQCARKNIFIERATFVLLLHYSSYGLLHSVKSVLFQMLLHKLWEPDLSKLT